MGSKKSVTVWRILVDFVYEGKECTVQRDHIGERTNILLEHDIKNFVEQERLGRVSNIRIEKYRMTHIETEFLSKARKRAKQ